MIKLYIVKRLNLSDDQNAFVKLVEGRFEWCHSISGSTFFEQVENAFVLKNELDMQSSTIKHAVLELKCDPTPVELLTQAVEE